MYNEETNEFSFKVDPIKDDVKPRRGFDNLLGMVSECSNNFFVVSIKVMLIFFLVGYLHSVMVGTNVLIETKDSREAAAAIIDRMAFLGNSILSSLGIAAETPAASSGKTLNSSPKYTVEDVLGLTNRFTVEYALGIEELKHDEK